MTQKTTPELLEELARAIRRGEIHTDGAIIILLDRKSSKSGTSYSWHTNNISHDELLSALVKVQHWSILGSVRYPSKRV